MGKEEGGLTVSRSRGAAQGGAAQGGRISLKHSYIKAKSSKFPLILASCHFLCLLLFIPRKWGRKADRRAHGSDSPTSEAFADLPLRLRRGADTGSTVGMACADDPELRTLAPHSALSPYKGKHTFPSKHSQQDRG